MARNVTPEISRSEQRICTCGHRLSWRWRQCRRCKRIDPAWSLFADPRVERSDDCWLWIGAKTAAGYGRFNNDYVHRLAWEEANGESAAGFEVMHHCDTPACVNPAHLKRATHKENLHDAYAKGRMNLSGLRRGNPGKSGTRGKAHAA